MVIAVSVAVALAAALLGACSQGASGGDSSRSGGATSGADRAASDAAAATGESGDVAVRGATTMPPLERPACTAPRVLPVEARPVSEGSVDRDRDLDMVSFDETKIRLHWFVHPDASESKPHPTVLMGPSWGLPGESDPDNVGVLGSLKINALRDAGFNVLTWDPRGFGRSTGLARIDDPAFEGKDVLRIIDWVSAQPEVQLDSSGDPRLGMVGGSYGGAIQMMVAGLDCRVDAIAPTVAWHSLVSSLDRANTPKAGWAKILSDLGMANVDLHGISASESMRRDGSISAEDRVWFAGRDIDPFLAKINVPTLLIQGTVDTLFSVDEAIANYRALRDRGIPVSMLWFCGGHGTCMSGQADPPEAAAAAVNWMRRYVIGDRSAELGPRVSLIDQSGTRFAADDYPGPAGPAVVAHGTGTLSLTADGGSGPPAAPPGDPDTMRGLVLPITPAKAANAVNVSINVGDSGATILGSAKVRLRYRGTPGTGDRPQRIFAQLVDEATGVVLGNQITPIEVTLDGKEHETTADLETVMFTSGKGSRLTLQLVARTVAYVEPQMGGSVELAGIDVELPTVTGLRQSGD